MGQVTATYGFDRALFRLPPGGMMTSDIPPLAAQLAASVGTAVRKLPGVVKFYVDDHVAHVTYDPDLLRSRSELDRVVTNGFAALEYKTVDGHELFPTSKFNNGGQMLVRVGKDRPVR